MPWHNVLQNYCIFRTWTWAKQLWGLAFFTCQECLNSEATKPLAKTLSKGKSARPFLGGSCFRAGVLNLRVRGPDRSAPAVSKACVGACTVAKRSACARAVSRACIDACTVGLDVCSEVDTSTIRYTNKQREKHRQIANAKTETEKADSKKVRRVQTEAWYVTVAPCRVLSRDGDRQQKTRCCDVSVILLFAITITLLSRCCALC